MKQSLTITKSGVTTWITPLSYDILIVVYLILLHLLKIHRCCKSVSYESMVQIRYYYSSSFYDPYILHSLERTSHSP